MKTILRALVGLSGLLSILMVLGLWFGMERILPAIGLMTNDLANGLVGRATVRADIAGLFGGMGLAMLDQGFLQVATEGAAHAQQVERFQYGGFTAAIIAANQVKAGSGLKAALSDIAQVADRKAGQSWHGGRGR